MDIIFPAHVLRKTFPKRQLPRKFRGSDVNVKSHYCCGGAGGALGAAGGALGAAGAVASGFGAAGAEASGFGAAGAGLLGSNTGFGASPGASSGACGLPPGSREIWSMTEPLSFES